MKEWINNPKIKQLDPLKQQLIAKVMEQTAEKSGESLAPILMALITTANRKGIRFSSEEIAMILDLLKNGKSEAEQKDIDHTVDFVNSLKKNMS